MFKRKILFCVILCVCVLKLTLSYPVATQDAKGGKSLSFEKSFSDENQNERLTNFVTSRQNGINIYSKAAAENGMDPVAVEDVIRTGKPIIKVDHDQNGAIRTTTYALQPDGSISKHTRTEYRPTLMSPMIPSKSHNKKPVLLSNFATEEENDWEWNPSKLPSWQIPSFTHAERPQAPQIPTEEKTPVYWHSPGTTLQANTQNGNSGTKTRTFQNRDNTKITTVHTVSPTEWHTRSLKFPWSEFDSTTTNTTTIPTLEDFLKSQYGTTIRNPTGSSQLPVATSSVFPQNPSTQPKFVTTININDLPIAEVLSNNEVIHSKIPNTSDVKSHTNIFTKTIQASGVPRVASLDPDMKEILDRAGINPMDARESPDGTVTKTRTEPGGKIITTTYRIQTVPTGTTHRTDSSNIFNLSGSERPQGPFLVKEKPETAHEQSDTQHSVINESNVGKFGSFGTKAIFVDQEESNHAVIRSQNSRNPIDEFLAKLNLTAEMIKASNGEIIKTIIDDNGRVLTSTLVLSTVRNDSMNSNSEAENKPIKRSI